MIRSLVLAAVVAGAALPAAAQTDPKTGPATERLSQCMTRKASDADRVFLVTWIYAAVSAHPAVRQYSTLQPADREALNKEVGEMMVRLLTRDCRRETVAALQADGAAAFEKAFGDLGGISMETMMSDKAVAKAMEGVAPYIDEKAFENLLSDEDS